MTFSESQTTLRGFITFCVNVARRAACPTPMRKRYCRTAARTHNRYYWWDARGYYHYHPISRGEWSSVTFNTFNSRLHDGVHTLIRLHTMLLSSIRPMSRLFADHQQHGHQLVSGHYGQGKETATYPKSLAYQNSQNGNGPTHDTTSGQGVVPYTNEICFVGTAQFVNLANVYGDVKRFSFMWMIVALCILLVRTGLPTAPALPTDCEYHFVQGNLCIPGIITVIVGGRWTPN